MSAYDKVPLVMFECGCIGFPPCKEDCEAVMVKFCDHDFHSCLYSLCPGPVHVDEYEPLDPEDKAKIIKEIAKYINMGFSFEVMRAMLREEV